MGFFGIVNCTSGPDLKYEYSYTSIFHLGLAARDTPDAPHNRLGTRGPSNSPKFPTCFTKIGRHTRIFLYCDLVFSHPSPDLSIGGASSDTFPTPSDQLFVVADTKEKANQSPSCPT
ncbi:Lipase, GDSL domain containing protein [Dorcoceras hygrometricum]|uniref:Lipase, GDSL domain containing protein n=1 Tax=Dorcoceras hygrometricum TaxID=472368 RepID=A0A2Z7CNW4_9LAMI|nr:Lipase, GDSL domain containing protein [Dorcoceras hygrometricum]